MKKISEQRPIQPQLLKQILKKPKHRNQENS